MSACVFDALYGEWDDRNGKDDVKARDRCGDKDIALRSAWKWQVKLDEESKNS